MRNVKRIGLAQEILPTHDEADVLQRVALLLLHMDEWHFEPGCDSEFQTFKQAWNKVKFHRRNKELCAHFALIDLVAEQQSLTAGQAKRLVDQGIKWVIPPQIRQQGTGNLRLRLNEIIKASDEHPVKLSIIGLDTNWIFKGIHFETMGNYSDEQFSLLILEEYDKERRRFEQLKINVGDDNDVKTSERRQRIPQSVRIEVWRRDGGKCFRCGSRKKLEYDHIVPVSKGGSNTARNVELLCEACNRRKSDNIK